MTSGMNVCDNVFNLLVKWSLYLRVIVMCSEPLFIIIQLRVYRREETIRTRNVSAHSAQSISVSSTSAWQSRQSTRKQTHSTCSRWHFQFSHDTVEKIRADCHRTGVKGIVDTREYSTTVKTVQPLPRVTWADVVKGTTQGKAIRGQEKMLKCSVSNKSVSRPLSRNNPVSKVKV